MDLIGAMLVVVLFAILLNVVRLVPKTREVISIGQQALATLRDTTLSDDEKERRMQQSSLRLIALLFVLTAGTLVALLVPIALIWLSEFAGLFTVDGVLGMFLRWDFILGGSILGIAAYFVSVKWFKRNS